MSPNAPGWLTARPIAHRGLHDLAQGRAENSRAAAEAAIAGKFAIECDVQLSADGEAMVFHDFGLDRLTGVTGEVAATTAKALATMALKGGGDRILALPDFLALVAGRTPVICEIKSAFHGDLRLAARAARCAAAYPGPLALKSFDPAVMGYLRANASALGIAHIPLGVVAQADYTTPLEEWDHLPREEQRALGNFLHWRETRPDFLSYGVADLPHAVPFLCREALRLPVMTWTVRTPEALATARQWADQAIFEGDLGL